MSRCILYELNALQTYPFGWEPDSDGFRGHVFVSTDNSTVVISIKGTSASWIIGGGGPTVQKDKLNDNLLFSCCCARVGPTWSPVCDCYTGSYRCDQTCLERALIDESLFYPIGIVNLFYQYIPMVSLTLLIILESIQQCDLHVSRRKDLDCWSFTWRRPCVSGGCDLWRSRCGIRSSRRKNGCSEVTSTIAGKVSSKFLLLPSETMSSPRHNT
jgi:hypothetical protein